MWKKKLNLKVKWFYRVVILCFLVISVQSQELTYRVEGRLIDSVTPITGFVVLTPSYNNWKSIDLNVEEVSTNADGIFSIEVMAVKGKTWRLFTSLGQRDGLDLLSPPFIGIGKYDRRFLGKPITFGESRKIDVGFVQPEYRFEELKIKVLSRNRNILTTNKWEKLWCRIRNSQGVVLAGRSLGPKIDVEEIDTSTSTLKLSIPEGVWTVEFLSYRDSTMTVGKKVLGTTGKLTVKFGRKLSRTIYLSN